MLMHPRCAQYDFAGDGKEELTKLSVWAQGPVMEESVGPKSLGSGGKLQTGCCHRDVSQKCSLRVNNVLVRHVTVPTFLIESTGAVTSENFSLTQFSPHCSVFLLLLLFIFYENMDHYLGIKQWRSEMLLQVTVQKNFSSLIKVTWYNSNYSCYITKGI